MAWYKQTNIRKQVFGVFTGVVIIIMIVSLVGITGINRMAEDVNALYYDRLYPAVEMAQITEKLYENRLFLEENLNTEELETQQELIMGITKNNKKIDSLISKYAESHLVDDENKNLLIYRTEISKYRHLEKEIIMLSKTDVEGAKMLFSKESSEEFRNMIEPIHKMTNIQLKIGQELKEDSLSEAKGIRLALYLSMGIILVLFIVLAGWLGFVYMNQG
jgi:Four helix bundle sensory module for signal transduction